MKTGRGMNKVRCAGRGTGGRRKQIQADGKGICRQQPGLKKRMSSELFFNASAGEAKVLHLQPQTIIPQLRDASRSDFIATGPARQAKIPTVTAIVDVDSCLLCGECEEACLAGAISVGETVEVDEEKCFGCGQCLSVCPANALLLVNK